MTVYYTATPRRVTLDLGVVELGNIVVPVDRLIAMALALLLTGILYVVMRGSRIGRAIVAVRMDREAALLMGIRVERIYAITFGIGALMAGAAGAVFAIVYPITTNLTNTFLGKAFVVCVIGGLGSVPGAFLGGLILGLVQMYAASWLGPNYDNIVAFTVLILVLLVRPAGLLGRGYRFRG